jgi:hypothetical protein
VIGIATNVTAIYAMGNIGNLGLLKPSINFAFWIDIREFDLLRVLQENTFFTLTVISDRRLSPATYWDLWSSTRGTDDVASIIYGHGDQHRVLQLVDCCSCSLQFVFGGIVNGVIVATHVTASIIVADEELEKVRIFIIIKSIGNDCTTVIPSK